MPTSFLSLSPELRNLIYEHAFLDPDPTILTSLSSNHHIFDHPLLRASKFIRREATLIFYDRYPLALPTHKPRALAAFFTAIGGRENASRIQKIRMPSSVLTPPFSASLERVRELCTGVREVTLTVSEPADEVAMEGCGHDRGPQDSLERVRAAVAKGFPAVERIEERIWEGSVSFRAIAWTKENGWEIVEWGREREDLCEIGGGDEEAEEGDEGGEIRLLD